MTIPTIIRSLRISIVCLMIHSSLHAAYWYRGFYGHSSIVFSPHAEGFTQETINKQIALYKSRMTSSQHSFWHVQAKRYEQSMGHPGWLDADNITGSFSTDESIIAKHWLGVGYRFLSGHAIELSGVYLSSSASYVIKKGAIHFDAPYLNVESKKIKTIMHGVMLMGKLRSPVFRVGQTLVNTPTALLSTVKTDEEIKGHNKKNIFSVIVHDLSFYAQGGFGCLRKSQSMDFFRNPPVITKTDRLLEVTEKPSVPWVFTGALGLGGQYHLGKRASIDFSWAYMVPILSPDELFDRFHVAKVGLNIYL